ncbi:MAG: hypothetical protein PHF86_10265 [Candidatus Nanoarchaeia archaeon]|nr:hypothetical protein [Candidatus Nanoarchaeia archaeon]
MKSTAKSIALMRDLGERISFRVAGSATIDTVRSAYDANGYPMIVLSDGGVETASNPVIGLRVYPIDAISKDVFGNTNIAFTPHVLELAYELAAGGEQTPNQLDLQMVLFECSKIGLKVNIIEIANGSAVDETNMNATAVAKSLEFDVINPMKGN